MKNIRLCVFGRRNVNGAWGINPTRIVNRLYYVNSGKAIISYAHHNYTLVGGKIYIIPQGHDFHTVDAVEFDHTFFDFYNSQILRHDTILEFDKTDLNSEALFSHINSLIASDQHKELRAEIEYFLCGYLSVLDKKYSLPYVSNSSVTEAVSLIHREPTALSTKLLAKTVNLDESYFIRLFSSVMGITPMKYIRACRIAYGKQLLQSGASVAEAAEKCGYASASSFYNAMKSELHVSPIEFIKGDK